MSVIVTDNKSCLSIYKPKSRTLHSTFKGVFNYALIMEHLQNGQKFSQNNEVLGALVDLRSLRGSFYKLFNYLEKEAYPNLKARGLTTQAFVVSDDLLTTRVTEKLMEMFKRLNIKAEIFTEPGRAETWLLEQLN